MEATYNYKVVRQFAIMTVVWGIVGMLVGVKLLLLAATAALALHARLRLIPTLRDDNLSGLAWHIRGITALAMAFVVVGALIRLGGLG